MDPNVTMLEVNPAQLEVLESLMQLRNEEPNMSQTISVPIQGTEEAVQTSVIQMDGEVETEGQLVTIVPMEDVESSMESSDKMVTFIAVDEMGNRVHLPDDVVTFVSVDDEGNTIQLDGNDLTQEQMQVIQVGMDLEAAQQDGGKVNILHGLVESIEVYKCDLCRQVFTKRSDWDDHECPGQQSDEVMMQPLSIQLDHQQLPGGIVIKEEDDSSLECNLCRRSFALRENWEQHMLSHLDKIEARPNSELEMKQLSIVDSGSNAVVLSAKTGDVEYRCDACGKRYQEKSELEKHLVTHIVDKFYECPICSNAFATKFSLRKHVINHLKGKGKPFKCEMCEKAFNQKVNLRAHMSVHTGLREFKCHICQKEFSLKGNLNKHLRIHTEERPFKCNICGRSFKVKEYLIQHRLTHTNELPFACGQCGRRFKLQEYADRHTLKCDGTRTSICEQCGMTYPTRGDLNRHIDEMHPEMKPYQCSTCNKRFKLKSYLQQHEISHTVGKNWVCGVCKKDFKCRHSLRQHLQWHTRQEKNEKFTCEVCGKEIQYELNMKRHMLLHSGNMPFTCEVCQRGFPDSSHLRRHMMRHNGEKPHKCELCGKGFYTTTHLKRHIKTHSSLLKPYACKICGKGFLTEEKMTRHFETHYGAVKGRFKCKFCDKACNKRSDLARHTLIHTGEKPYKCDICGMAFRTSTHRKRHLLTHTTEKPFMCMVCNKSFKSRDVLKKHEAIHKEGKSGWKKYCKLCGKGFKFVFKLREHEERGCNDDVPMDDADVTKDSKDLVVSPIKPVVSEEEQRPHKCALCNRRFKNLQHLSRHEATHKDDEGESSLLDDEEADEEEEEAEVVENELQCKLCSKQFDEQASLEKHKSYCKVKPFEPTTITYINKKPPKLKANQCSLCGKAFSKGAHALNQHISLMHKVEDFIAANSPVPDSFYKCDQCGKLFNQAHNWKKHVATHKEEGEVCVGDTVSDAVPVDEPESSDKPHKCGFCGISFRESTNLVKHLLALHYKKPADSTVPGAFTAKVDMENKLEDGETATDKVDGNEVEESEKLSETGEKQVETGEKQVESGEKQVESGEKQAESDASDADRLVGIPNKPFKCEKCSKWFADITFLNKHILSKHPPSKTKKKIKSTTSKTMSEYSSIEFPFACDDCGVKFRTPGGLNTHKESLCLNVSDCEEGMPYRSPEQKKKKHRCSACDSEFPSTVILLKHMKRTHKHIKHLCYMCGKGYPKEAGLKQHITQKHGEPKTPKSSKITAEPVSSERKFICEHCHRGFRTESQLKRHTPTHKGDHTDFITDIKKEPMSPVPAAYSCDCCPATFHQHSELRDHMLATHTDDSEDNGEHSSMEECEDSKEFEIVRGNRQTELSVAVEKLPVCSVCGDWFSSAYVLKAHMVASHGTDFDAEEDAGKSTTKSTGFSCRYCDMVCSTRFNLKTHETAKHQKQLTASTRSQTATVKQSKVSSPAQKHSKSEKSVKPQAKVSTPVRRPSRSATPVQAQTKPSTPVQTHSKPSTPAHKTSRSSTPVRASRSSSIQSQSKSPSRSSKSQSKSTPVEPLSPRSAERAFRCRSCKREFRTESQLIRHQRTHDREDTGADERFKCKVCEKVFSRESNLKSHMSSHVKSEDETKRSPRKSLKKSSDVDEKFECETCGKVYPKYVNLKRHMVSHESSEVTETEVGSKSPRSTHSLTLKKETKLKSKTVTSKPSLINKKKCRICRKVFPSVSSIKAHMINVHKKRDMEVGLHKCIVCNKGFATFWDLKKHKLIRHRRKLLESQMKWNVTEKINKSIFTPNGERITKCDLCGGWFPNLKIHMDSQHPGIASMETENKDKNESLEEAKKMRCNICGKTYSKMINLKIHKKMIHNVNQSRTAGKSVKIHECALCGRQFEKPSSLKMHIAMKHNEYRKKLDKLKSKEARAVKIHECALCGTEFAKSSSLKMHIAMKHSEYHKKLDKIKTDIELDRDPVVNTCVNCQKDFPDLSAWFTHKLTNCGDETPRCICCDKMFIKTWNLKIHYFRLHNIRSAADVTEQGSSRLVVEHTYCRESGLEAMKCPHCPKRFTAQQKLKLHLKMHKKKGLNEAKSQATKDRNSGSGAKSQATKDRNSGSGAKSQETMAAKDKNPGSGLSQVDEISITLPGQEDAFVESGEPQPMEVESAQETDSTIHTNAFIVTLNEDEKISESDSFDVISKTDVCDTQVNTSETVSVSAGLSAETSPVDGAHTSLTSQAMDAVTEADISTVFGIQEDTSVHAVDTVHCSIDAVDSIQAVDAVSTVDSVQAVDIDADNSITAVPFITEDGVYNQLEVNIEGELVGSDCTYTVIDGFSDKVEDGNTVYVTNCATEALGCQSVELETESVTYYEETVSNPDDQTTDANELYEQALSQLVDSEKAHKCDVCGRQCATPWSLKQHMETHGTATSVSEQSFAHMLDLVQTGNSAPYKCDVCSRTFSKSSQLTRHRATHKEQQEVA